MKALLLPAVLLAGCQSLPPMTHDAAEKAQCESYGLVEGSPQYVECRLRTAEMRQQRSQALMGAGLGILSANQPYATPAQPSPFSSYNIKGRAYHCSTLGTHTSCQ